MHNHSSTPPGQSRLVARCRISFSRCDQISILFFWIICRRSVRAKGGNYHFSGCEADADCMETTNRIGIRIQIGEGEQHVVDATEDRGTKKHKKGSYSCKEKPYDRPPAEIGAKRARQAGVIGGQEKTMNPVGCRGCDLTRKQPVSNDGVWKMHGRRSHDPEQFEAQCAWLFKKKSMVFERKKVITYVDSILFITCEPLRSRPG